MSKTFRVLGRETTYLIWEVEADNAEEAKERANDIGMEKAEIGKSYFDYEEVEELNTERSTA